MAISPELAIVVFATGEKYESYIQPFISSLHDFFPPHDIILFTDSKRIYDAITIPCTASNFTEANLQRFPLILREQARFQQYKYIFLFDLDMLACQPVNNEEILGDGLTATLHPMYPDSFERRKESAACVVGHPTYFHCCPVGGATQEFLKLAKSAANGIESDRKIGIIGAWWDESYVNHYFWKYPPAKILTPSYCFPDLKYLVNPERWLSGNPKDFKPKIMHLEKGLPHNAPQDALIAICTCDIDKYKERVQIQQETWIKDARMRGWNIEIMTGARLGVSDDYLFLPVKTKAIVQWALDRGYEHLLKMDDDGYLVASRLAIPPYEYAGIVFSPQDSGKPEMGIPDYPSGTFPYSFASGGGYWLGKRAMQIVASSDVDDCWAEDRWVGDILGKAGITLASLPDYVFFESLDSFFLNRYRIEHELEVLPDNTVFQVAQNESAPSTSRMVAVAILVRRQSKYLPLIDIHALLPHLNKLTAITQVDSPASMKWLHQMLHNA
jgi:hypothetical protein